MTEQPMEPAEALLRAATWLKRLRMPGVAPCQQSEDDQRLDQGARDLDVTTAPVERPLTFEEFLELEAAVNRVDRQRAEADGWLTVPSFDKPATLKSDGVTCLCRRSDRHGTTARG